LHFGDDGDDNNNNNDATVNVCYKCNSIENFFYVRTRDKIRCVNIADRCERILTG